MKIGFFSDSFLPTIGGAQFATHHAANEIAARGHEVVVLGDAQDKPDLDLPVAYRVSRCPVRRHRRIPAAITERLLARSFRGWLGRERPDVVIAVMAYLPGYVAARVRAAVPFPLVVSSRGADVQTHKGCGYGFRLNPRLEPKVRYALSHADVCLSNSDSMRVEQIDAGADPQRALVVYNGVGMSEPEQGSAVDLKTRFALPPDARTIICPSRYHVKKNLELAVRAMPEVRRALPRARLIFLGDHLARLDRVLAEVGVEGILRSTPLTGAAYARALATADALVMPSFIEGCCNAILEAYALGTPVVASDAPGNRDIVSDGETGLLAPVDDPQALARQLLRVLQDDALRRRLVDGAARAARERYTWSRNAEGQLAACEMALRHGRER